MKEFLAFAAENAVVVINAVALVIIVLGTIEAFLRDHLRYLPPVGDRP